MCCAHPSLHHLLLTRMPCYCLPLVMPFSLDKDPQWELLLDTFLFTMEQSVYPTLKQWEKRCSFSHRLFMPFHCRELNIYHKSYYVVYALNRKCFAVTLLALEYSVEFALQALKKQNKTKNWRKSAWESDFLKKKNTCYCKRYHSVKPFWEKQLHRTDINNFLVHWHKNRLGK